MIGRLALGLGLFLVPLLGGWWLHRCGRFTERHAKSAMRFAVRWLSPIVMGLSFWRLELTDPQVIVLPVLGCVIALSTLLPAWGYARAARLSGPETGAFLVCGVFSNQGYFGAVVAFALFGELAYTLSMLYLIYFSPCFYLLGFTIAKRCGHRPPPPSAQDSWGDELRFSPFLGLCVGLGLNLAGVERPAVCESINQLLIPLGTIIHLGAIGSQLRFEPLGRWLGPCLAMGAIKFWYTPLVAWGLVSLFDVRDLPRFVVLCLSSTPVAISALMLPLLFGTDRKLSNALLVFTTLLAIPWLLVYLLWIR